MMIILQTSKNIIDSMSQGQLNKENMNINQVVGKVISVAEHRIGQYKTGNRNLSRSGIVLTRYKILYLLKLTSILSLESISPGSNLYLVMYVLSGVLCIVRRVQKLCVIQYSMWYNKFIAIWDFLLLLLSICQTFY